MCVTRRTLIEMATLQESFVTLKEMVVGPSHTAYRRCLQTTLCGWEGNWLVVNDNWKAEYNQSRWASERWTEVNHWWGVVKRNVGSIKTKAHLSSWENDWREPVYCQLGARHRDGMNLMQALSRNVRSRDGMISENAESENTQGRK